MQDCQGLDLHLDYFPFELFDSARKNRIPINAQFELTARCNFSCKMCYIHMSDAQIQQLGKELTTTEWLRIAEEAKECGTLYLSLTGGEVFTRPDFRELYEELSVMGFLIQIMTNASLIDESVMEWLSQKPPYNISITLYGSNNEVYESVCGINNGFSRVDHAISLLQQAKIPISLKSVLIKNNEKDAFNQYRYAVNHNLRYQSTFGVNKPVRGATSSAEEVRRTIDSPPPNLMYRPKPSNISHGPFIHHKNYLDDCGAYGSTLNITWDGKVVLCSFMDQPYVNIRDHSVNDAWSELLSELKKIQKPKECNSCAYEEYCMRCPGVLAAESGFYNTIDNSYCNRAKYLHSLYNKAK